MSAWPSPRGLSSLVLLAPWGCHSNSSWLDEGRIRALDGPALPWKEPFSAHECPKIRGCFFYPQGELPWSDVDLEPTPETPIAPCGLGTLITARFSEHTWPSPDMHSDGLC